MAEQDWITDRPPNTVEVPAGQSCWVTRSDKHVADVAGSSKLACVDGKSVRHYWGEFYIAWMQKQTPEPYQPPKPKRRAFWICNVSKTRTDVYECEQEGWDDRPFPDQVHVREVFPNDIDPDKAIELQRRVDHLLAVFKLPGTFLSIELNDAIEALR